MKLKFEKRSEQDNKQKIIEDAERAAENAAAAAQACLNTEGFEGYRQKYEILEKRTLAELLMIDQTYDDPVKYGFAVKDCISQLRHIGSLLRGVNADAGKQN